MVFVRFCLRGGCKSQTDGGQMDDDGLRPLMRICRLQSSRLEASMQNGKAG